MRVILVVLLAVSSVSGQGAVPLVFAEPGPYAWNGFLRDLRTLRRIGLPRVEGTAALAKKQYQEAADTLERKPRTIAEKITLAGYRYRLGQFDQVLEVSKTEPANAELQQLAVLAWIGRGDKAEALRLAEAILPETDDLRRWLTFKNVPEPEAFFGKGYAVDEAINRVQHLLLRMPNDARLLALLGDLAAASGDVRTAVAILDGVVTEYGLPDRDVRGRRQDYRREAARINQLPEAEHVKFRGTFRAKSPRPVLRWFDPERVPGLLDGSGPMPWAFVDETTLGKPFRPSFGATLASRDGKTIRISGYLYPTDPKSGGGPFLLTEEPIGCWFCETLGPTELVQVLPGEGVMMTRDRVIVEGRLELNRTDPEGYLITVHKATVRKPD